MLRGFASSKCVNCKNSYKFVAPNFRMSMPKGEESVANFSNLSVACATCERDLMQKTSYELGRCIIETSHENIRKFHEFIPANHSPHCFFHYAKKIRRKRLTWQFEVGDTHVAHTPSYFGPSFQMHCYSHVGSLMFYWKCSAHLKFYSEQIRRNSLFYDVLDICNQIVKNAVKIIFSF